jgi:VanZ family protein
MCLKISVLNNSRKQREVQDGSKRRINSGNFLKVVIMLSSFSTKQQKIHTHTYMSEPFSRCFQLGNMVSYFGQETNYNSSLKTKWYRKHLYQDKWGGDWRKLCK